MIELTDEDMANIEEIAMLTAASVITTKQAYRAGMIAGMERAAKVHEPSCSCTEPCDEYFIWPSPCHKKAAAAIRALIADAS